MKKFLLFVFILLSTDVFAFEKTTNFTFEKFEKAQLDGKTIVINAWNQDCIICAKQSKIFVSALDDFKDVEFLFYEQTKNKDIAKALDIRFWTTIVVFKGKKEVAREIGLVRKEEIYKIIEKGI